MRKKFVLPFLCILFLTIISLFLFIYSFINQHMLQNINKQNNKNITFFSGYVFNTNIFGKTDKHNMFNTELIDVGDNFLYSPEIVTLNKDQWIVLMHKNNVSIYSISKNQIYQFPVPYGNIISGCISSLNNNKEYELLLLISKTKTKYADDLIVSSIIDDSKSIIFKVLCKKSLKNFKPWKIQTCDVDGDGKKEISIGMYKTTPFHPVMAKRPFVYQWINNSIAPKWLGSRLSRPFDDYIFADINQDGRDELISIERLQNDHKIVSAYAWKGFGFESIGDSSEFQDVLEITKGNNVKGNGYDIIAKAKLKTKVALYTLKYKNGTFITEELK